MTWSELAAHGYPGAAEHPADQQAWVTVATTRPETYLGDTAVAISQHDPRAKPLRGLFVQLPIVGRVIPIIEDTSGYVVLPKAYARTDEERDDPKAEFATGFLKVTPAHDNNDYQLGQLYAEQIKQNSAGEVLINILSPEGRLSDQHGWADIGDARRFVGLKATQTHDGIRQPAEARKAVVEALKSHPIGSDAYPVLERVRPYKQTLMFSDRSKALIEPYVSDQWFCKVTDDRMAGAANRALHDSGLTFHPARYAKTYEQWHTGIRDWCISRQLWWGHRIPVWSRPSGNMDDQAALDFTRVAKRFVDEGRLARHHSGSEPGPLDPNFQLSPQSHWCVRRDDDSEVIAHLTSHGFTQDPDVLDTWFSSALWPLSTLGWPDPDQSPDTKGLLAAFNPSSLLSTAREIITLWVSRMVMMNRYLLGEGGGRGPVPFKDVFIHAVVQDGTGTRMSKSAGNGVDPLDIIASHGADAMRFTLCQMTTSTQDVRMPVLRDPKTSKNTSPKFDLGRNVCNKLWNAARFAMTMLESASGESRFEALSPADRWMLSRLALAAGTITRAIREYDFSGYAQALYDLLWRDFCDWYLEAIKPTVQTDPGTRAVLVHTLGAILRLAHPLLPYVTEAIYEHVRTLRSSPIRGIDFGRAMPEGTPLALMPWPVIDESFRDASAEAQFTSLQDLAGIIREARSQHKVEPKRKIVLHADAPALAPLGPTASMLPTFAGLSEVRAGSPSSGDGVKVTFGASTLTLTSLADALDTGAERERLAKHVAELEKAVAALKARLDNPSYASRAPAHLVEQSRSELAAKQAEWEAARRALEAS